MGVIEESMSAWEGSTLTLEAILAASIVEWEASTERREMREGVDYYRVKNAIMSRVMYSYDLAGNKEVDPTAANNRIPHGFMRLAIDEKVAYLLGVQPTYTAPDVAKLQTAIQTHLASHFADKLIDWAGAASKCGIGWLHPYVADESLRFAVIPSDQVIPLWDDDDHEVLQGIIRTYLVTEYQGEKRVEVRKVELWTAETVMYYVEETEGDEKRLIADIAANDTGEPKPHLAQGDKAYAWGIVPFIPLKNNSDEQPSERLSSPCSF